MNEQLLKDFIATAQKYNYDWNKTFGLFPELKGYDQQVLKDYVATAEKYSYDYSKVNSLFPEFGFAAPQQELKKKEQPQPQAATGAQAVQGTAQAAQAKPATGLPSVASSSGSSSANSFSQALSKVTSDIIDMDEEDAVPKLNEIFREQGFKFDQTGLGDNIEVTAPNGQKKTFKIDMWTQEGDQQVADELKNWASQNKGDFSAKKAEVSESDFSKSLESITPDLASKDEDFIIPQLQGMFGDYGFQVSTSGVGDNVVITAPNKKSITIPVDRWTQKGDIESSSELKKFISENKPVIPKLTEDYSIYESRIRTEEDLKNVKKTFNDEVTSLRREQQNAVIENAWLEKESKALSAIPQSQRSTQEYADRVNAFNQRKDALTKNISALSEREKDLGNKSAQLDASIGRYTSMKAQQGNFFEGLWESYLGAQGSTASAVTNFMYDIGSAVGGMGGFNYFSDSRRFVELALDKGIDVPQELLISPENWTNETRDKFKKWHSSLNETQKGVIEDKIQDENLKKLKGEMLPVVRNVLKDKLGSETTTEEYLREGGMVKQGLFGLAGSSAAMMAGGPAARVAAFALQGFDATMNEMSSDEFKDVSENEKYMVAVPIAIASGVLEEFGLRNVIGKSGVVNNLVLKAIGKAGANTTAKSFKELVENEVEDAMSRGLLTIGGAALAEAETGGLQAAAEIGIKEIYNAAKGKDLFRTPESAVEFIQEVGEAAIMESIGGFTMGIPTSIATAISENNFNGIKDSDVQLFSMMANDSNFKEAMVIKVKQGITDGTITEEKGKALIEAYDKGAAAVNSMPDNLTPAAKRKAMSLLIEKSDLQKQVDGKDEALVKKQRERINEINEELSNLPEAAPAEAAPAEAAKQKMEKELRESLPYEHYESILDSEFEWERRNAKEFLEDPKAYFEKNIEIAKQNLERNPDNKISQNVLDDNTEKLRIFNEITNKYKDAIQKQGKPAEAAPMEAAPITYEQLSQEAKDMIGVRPDTLQKAIDEAKEQGREPDKYYVDQLELLKSNPIKYVENTIERISSPDVKEELQQALTKIKEDQDAIQKQTAGQVPVQPTARVGEEVEEGAPQAEPQVPAQKGLQDQEIELTQQINELEASLADETQQDITFGETTLPRAEAEAKLEQLTTEREAVQFEASLQEEVSSRTPQAGVSVSNKSQLKALATKTTDKAKSGVIAAASRAVNTLKSVFPDMDIVIHETTDGFVSAGGNTTSRGNFQVTRDASGKIVKGVININLENADITTVAHEVAHAVMLKAFGDNPALFKRFRDRINTVLANTTIEQLDKFASEYNEADSHEEYLVELSAILSATEKQLPTSVVQRIAELINKVVSMATKGAVVPFKGTVETKQLIDFLNTMSSSIAKGEGINVGELDISSVGVSGEIVSEGVKRKDSLISGQIQRFPTNPNTRVEENVPLSRFNGKRTNVMESDRMIGGYIADSEGKPMFKFLGGVYFPIITGKWWASRTETKVKQIAENANKNRDKDGYVYSAPMIGSDKQHMSNSDMLFTTIELMKNDVSTKKSGVKKDELIGYIKKAFDRKDVSGKKKLVEKILNKSNSINSIFNELEFILFQDGKNVIDRDGKDILDENGKPITNFTFEERLAVVETLLGDPKVKTVRFPSAGSISEAAKRFEEPITKKASIIGDMVALFRTKGTLKYKKTDPSDPFFHKSYPFEIYSVDEKGNPAEVEVYVLDGAYSMKDALPKLTRSSGGEFTWSEYIEKHKKEKVAAAQYSRTAKLSSASGEVTTTKQQVEAYHGSPYDFEKFTTKKMGTGEGAQAFGWGLYFTDIKSIAEQYANKLSKETWLYDGKEVSGDTIDFLLLADEPLLDIEWNEKRIKELAPLAIDKIKNEYIPDYEQIKISNPKQAADMDNRIRIANESIKELNDIIDSEKISKYSNKKVYTVSLHEGKTPDQYTWLEWDKELTPNQIKSILEKDTDGSIQEALNKYYSEYNDISNVSELIDIIKEENTTGERLYKILENYIGEYPSDKEASLALLRAGIDGVKYPAESISRGATSATSRGSNYVVFDENAVTIKTKEQKGNEAEAIVKQGRANGVSENAIKSVLSRRGFTAEQIDAAMAKPEAAGKTKVDETFAEGFDRLMKEIEGIIKKSTYRKRSQEDILDNVVNYVIGSKLYENATDVQREQMIRDARKRFGKREKSAPKVETLLGGINSVDKITIAVRDLVANQIKSLARGAKDAKKAWMKASAILSDDIKDMVASGKISSKQAAAVIKRFAKVDMFNETSVDNFVNYMAKVFADAEYDEKIAGIKSKLKTAKKNIYTKLGISKNLVPLLDSMLAINPTLVPDSVFDTYVELVDMLSKREAVLSLQEVNTVTEKTEKILDAINKQESVAAQAYQQYLAYDKKVIKDNEVDFAATVKKMVEDNSITEAEAEILRKYKNRLMEREGKKKTEQEIAQERNMMLIALDIVSVTPDALPSRIERDAAAELIKLSKSDAVKGLDNIELNNLLKALDNIANGYFPHQAQLLIERLNAINRSKPLATAEIKAKPLAITKVYASIKSLITRNKTALEEMIRRSPLKFIDQVFGDFKTNAIFKSLFEPISSAYGQFASNLKRVENRLDDAYNNILKSHNGNPLKTLMSSYKITAYMIQNEFDSNKGSKQVNKASDFLKATIKQIYAGESHLSEKNAQMLQEVLDWVNKFTDADGNVDTEAMLQSMSKAERDAIGVVRDINDSLTEKAMFTASVIRGEKIKPLNNYIHLQVMKNNYNPEDNTVNESDSMMFSDARKPSSKAKNLVERTGDVSPINFDIFSSAQRGARFVLLDYHMTPAIRTARKTLAETKKSLENEDGIIQDKKTRQVNSAINNVFEEVLRNTLSNTFTVNSFAEEVVDYISKTGYRAVLAGVPRFTSELTSNMAFATIIDPEAFSQGVKLRGVSMSAVGADVMLNLGSGQVTRIYSNDPLTGRLIDTQIMSQSGGKRMGKANRDVANKLQQIYNNTLGKYKNSVEFVADTLIATPDKIVMRSMWFGSFAKEFKKITGVEPDFDKIAANDEAYMNQYKDALKESTSLADEKTILTASTDNPFMGILKGAPTPNQSGFVKAFNIFNNYMTRFLIYEYMTARMGIMAAMGNGYLTKKQGAAMLGAVLTRMTVYTFLMSTLTQLMVGLFVDEEDEDDEKSLLQKFGQSFTSAVTGLMLGRDFGNATKSIINYGIELGNQEFLDFLREGEYDPYKDAIAFTPIPVEPIKKDGEEKKGGPPSNKGLYDFIIGMTGPFAPTIKTADLIIKKGFEEPKKTPEAIERQRNVKQIRIPLEVLGNLGLIPLYKDVRKVTMAAIYKDIDKASKKSEAEKAQEELDKPPYGLTMEEYKRYFPKEYEKRYGEDSEYRKRKKYKNRLKDAKDDMRRKMLDEFYNYEPKKKKKGFGSEGFGDESFGDEKLGGDKKSKFGSKKFGEE